MKKLHRILATAMLMIMALTLTACGDDLEGSWKLTGGTALSDFIGADEGMSLEDMGMSITFSFNSGNKFVMSMSAFGVSDSYNGTWKTDGDTLTMTVDGDPMVCSYIISGDTLTLAVSDGGMSGTLVFTKN